MNVTPAVFFTLVSRHFLESMSENNLFLIIHLHVCLSLYVNKLNQTRIEMGSEFFGLVSLHVFNTGCFLVQVLQPWKTRLSHFKVLLQKHASIPVEPRIRQVDPPQRIHCAAKLTS